MKSLVLVFFFLYTFNASADPRCDKYVNNRAQFTTCVAKLCEGSEAQTKACLTSYKAYLAGKPELKQTVTNHLVNVQNIPQKCSSNDQCGADLGCYNSDYRELLEQIDAETDKEETSFLQLMEYVYPGNVLTKPYGETCTNSFECSSNFCASGRCLKQVAYCRKAKRGEKITLNIKCEDPLKPDANNVCQNSEFFATTEKLLLDSLYTGSQLNNTCNTTAEYQAKKEEFEKTIKERSHIIRSFEILFSDVDTYSPENSMLGVLKKMAGDYRKQRETLILQFNKDVAEFQNDFKNLNNAKKDSEAMIEFPVYDKSSNKLLVERKPIKEAEIYTEKVTNNLHLALLQSIEEKRFNFYGGLTKLYETYLADIEKFRAAYFGKYNIFQNQLPPFSLTVNNWLKMKKKEYLSYLEDFNEGAVLNRLKAEGYPSLLPGGTKYLVDFPLSKIDDHMSDLIEKEKFDQEKKDCFLDTDWSWCKNRGKLWKSESKFWDKMLKMSEALIKDYYKNSSIKTELGKMDPELAMVDPELRYFKSCLSDSVSAENKKYCEQFAAEMTEIKTQMLVDFVLYSGNNGNKKYKNAFVGEKQEPSDPNRPTLFYYSYESSRGFYLNKLYESAWYLHTSYKKIFAEKEQRLECIARNYFDGQKSEHDSYGSTGNTGLGDPNGGRGFTTGNSSGGITNDHFQSSNLGSTSSDRVKQNTRNYYNPASASTDLTGSTLDSSISVQRSGTSGIGPQASLGTPTALEKTEVNGKLVDEAYGSYKKNAENYDNKNNSGSRDSFFDDSAPSASVRQISSLSSDESEHVMNNLDEFKATGRSRNSIFETISEVYVQQGYPAIFLPK